MGFFLQSRVHMKKLVELLGTEKNSMGVHVKNLAEKNPPSFSWHQKKFSTKRSSTRKWWRFVEKKTHQTSLNTKRSLVGFFCKIELTWKEPMELFSALRKAQQVCGLEILQKKPVKLFSMSKKAWHVYLKENRSQNKKGKKRGNKCWKKKLVELLLVSRDA